MEAWIRFCGHKSEWKPQKNQGICSEHFEPESYDSRYQTRHDVIGAKLVRHLVPNGG